MHDFDVILGIAWFFTYRVQVDCFAKMITFQLPKECYYGNY